MTAIAGAIDGADVIIGADSAVTDSWLRTTLVHSREPKAFLLPHETIAVGLSGAFRPLQLMRQFAPPASHTDWEASEYLSGAFVDALRGYLRSVGALHAADGVESMPDTAGLIGYAGRLFHLEADLSCWEHAEPYAAHGHGYQFALGALRSLSIEGITGERLVRGALEAAAYHDATVRGPFVIVRLKGATP